MNTASIRLRAFVLCGWTAFVWVTRIRNAFGDDDLGTGARAIALVTAVGFTVIAATVAFGHLRKLPWAGAATVGFAMITSGYWVVRMITIISRDHSAAFIIVHCVLGLVSIALSVWATLAALGLRRSPDELARTVG